MKYNTNPKIAAHMAHKYSHKQLLTPTLMYIWNAEADELEALASEILGRISPEFIGQYIRYDISKYQGALFMIGDGSLEVAFSELCNRAGHSKLREMSTYIHLLLNSPCKTEECQKDCNDHYRNTNHAC